MTPRFTSMCVCVFEERERDREGGIATVFEGKRSLPPLQPEWHTHL
jgi:hypothetical protein